MEVKGDLELYMYLLHDVILMLTEEIAEVLLAALSPALAIYVPLHFLKQLSLPLESFITRFLAAQANNSRTEM